MTGRQTLTMASMAEEPAEDLKACRSGAQNLSAGRMELQGWRSSVSADTPCKRWRELRRCRQLPVCALTGGAPRVLPHAACEA